MRRHLRELGQLNEYGGHKMCLSSNDLSMLAVALPQLRSLTVRLTAQTGGALWMFPPRLEQLNVSFGEKYSLDENTTALLASISRLSRLHKLRLNFRSAVTSIAPLQQLPLLRDLVLRVAFQHHTEQFATDLRALSGLHRLRVGGPLNTTSADCAALLIALLRDTPQEQMRTLQWRDFFIRGLDFTDELTSLLPRLPSLERLRANLMRCTCFDFLSALSRLTHLELYLSWITNDAWRNLVSVFTSDGLAGLRTLSLRGGPCDDDELKILLSHTPSLTSLILAQLSQVTSLSFFLQLPKLAESLTQLTVDCWCQWHLTAASLLPLLFLQQLRTLRLLHWPSEEPDVLTAKDLAPFEQRPCVVLPHLEVFEWKA